MAAPYGDGRYAVEPPDSGGLNIEDIFHIVEAKPDDPGINSRIDSQYPNVAIITFDDKNQFGGMWAKEQLDLTLPFSTKMYLYLEHAYDNPDTEHIADGMTFTLQNDDAGNNAIGGAGEGLGVYRGRKWIGPGYETEVHGTFLRNSLVVEFDTYQNSDALVKDPGEPSTCHCAVLLPRANSIVITDHQRNFFFDPRPEWLEFEATWTPDGNGGGTLDYTFDGFSRQFTVDNVQGTFGGTKVYWGFTGSTGNSTSVQAAAITALPTQGIRVEKEVHDLDGNDIDHGVVSAGETVSYTIRVTALQDTDGPFDIGDDVSDLLQFAPTGNVILTTSDGSTYTLSYTMSGTTMSVINAEQAVLTKDDWFEITFEAIVSDDAVGETIINGATVSTDILSENSNKTDITVYADPVKTVSDGSDAGQNGSAVEVGDLITYSISYGNESADAVNIIITDTLPDGVDFVSASGSYSLDLATNTITWEFQNADPGDVGNVTVTVRVNETAVVTIENTATVQIGEETHDVSVVNPVTPEDPVKTIDLESEAGQGGSAVKLGDNVTYSITYLNNLTVPATVTIIDVLPDGVDFVRASDGSNYDLATHTVTWTLTGVPSGASGIAWVTVQVNKDAVVRIENEATVQVGEQEPLPTNPVVNPVTPENPVKMISEDSRAGQSGGAVKEGDRITYDITYLNHHEADATIVITDVLDPGVDFVSASDGGVYDEATRTVTWTLNNVASAEGGAVSLVVQVNETAAETIENSATVKVGDDGELTTNIVVNPLIKFQCPKISRACRISIEGCKIWADNDNVDDTRPPTVEIVLLRDGVVYRRKTIDSTGDGKYIFACLPVWKNSEDRYSYQIDEPEIPANYVMRVEGYNVINTLTT